MTAAYEELIHLLDEREIGYSASDDQAIRTDLRGVVAAYRIVAKVEAGRFSKSPRWPPRRW